jgi:hypothetical protein
MNYDVQMDAAFLMNTNEPLTEWFSYTKTNWGGGGHTSKVIS